MTYLTPTKKKKNYFTSITFVIFILLLLLSVSLFSFFNPIFIKVSSSIKNSFNSLSLITYFKSKNALEKENSTLKEKNNELVALNANLNNLELENNNLKEFFNKKDDKKMLLANVIQGPGFSPYDILVINSGLDKKVSVGQKVFYGNLVIGEIIDVNNNTATASLYSSAGKIFPVIIGAERITGEAKGQGGGGFRSEIPKGIIVKTGDEVYLPEESLKIFGIVTGVASEDNNPLQQVFFSLPINPYEIKNVYVSI